MVHHQNIGGKIKSLRKRAGMSQMELELELEASPGSLSRIESGEVNPTKETLFKIENVLNLNARDRDFLIDKYPSEVSTYQLQEAIKEVYYMLASENNFCYLVDERFRAWELSKGFQKLWRLNDSEVSFLKSRHILELMFLEELPTYLILQTKSFDNIARAMIARFRTEVPYWSVDEYSKSVIDRLMNIPRFKKIWNTLSLEDLATYTYGLDSRRISFNISGVIVETDYARESLKQNPRFLLVSYIPNKRFFDLIKANFKEFVKRQY